MKWISKKSLLATAFLAATLTNGLPSEPVGGQDWRTIAAQLKEWRSKSMDEVRREADGGSAMANYILFTALFQAKAPQEKWNIPLLKAAEGGIPQAQFDYGFNNRYRIDDWEVWIAKAAETGLPVAQTEVALGYLKPTLKQNKSKGIELLRKASDQDWGRAMAALGYFYSQGIAQPRNAEETPLKLYLKAVSGKWIGAMYELAHVYRHGEGTEKDLLEASRWLVNANVSGYDGEWPGHQGWVFDYLDADGKARPDLNKEDQEFANVLGPYFQAVVLKNPDALMKVGEMYEKGLSSHVDLVRAYASYQLAGGTGGAAEAARLQKKLTPDQKTKADELVPVWREFAVKQMAFLFVEHPNFLNQRERKVLPRRATSPAE